MRLLVIIYAMVKETEFIYTLNTFAFEIFYFITEDVLLTLTNVMESFTEIHFYLVFVL